MSEFSEIQPASQGGRLSGPISVESGRDLAAGFTKAGNAGQKVELFFALAENHPQVAVPAFAEILETKASAPMRALALQGLGKNYVLESVEQIYKTLATKIKRRDLCRGATVAV
ncbi:MAG: hypothetical protein KME26_25295 [Oscillatoria princeps RMCB-10]|nr:hypothetical protein [Oscillatoria princeps RMCB-10]